VGEERGSRGERRHAPRPSAQPQNILGMLHAGTRDIGFAGYDWVQELGVEVVEVLDTGLDPVRLVVAAPDPDVLTKGGLGGRKLIIASEYAGVTLKWLAAKKVDAEVLRAYGATESLPPEDADAILDNTATGSTLKANGLTIIDEVMQSTTRLFASKAAWADPAKRKRIEEFALVLRSVLQARSRRMLTFNCAPDKLAEILPVVPCMRAPSVSQLIRPFEHSTTVEGYAIQSAVEVHRLPELIPRLKALGATDIIVSDIHQVML
jgi:ATP phosphoribosyltransferase